MKLSLWQRFILKLNGVVCIGMETRDGWSGYLPFYAFRCPEHGLVKNYKQGHKERLYCPECLERDLKRMEAMVDSP